MNARQKAKKLKKELEELKADKTGGFKWLKIDGFSQREKPRLWYDNTPLILNYIPVTYEIQIGHTTVEITLEDPEDIFIVIDSKKLDQACNDALDRRKAYEYTKKLERVKENERETEGKEIQKDS